MANNKGRILNLEFFDGWAAVKTFFAADSKGHQCECFLKNIGVSAVGPNTWMAYEVYGPTNDYVAVVSEPGPRLAKKAVIEYLGRRGSCYKEMRSVVGG